MAALSCFLCMQRTILYEPKSLSGEGEKVVNSAQQGQVSKTMEHPGQTSPTALVRSRDRCRRKQLQMQVVCPSPATPHGLGIYCTLLAC